MIHVLSRQGFKDTNLKAHVISIWGTNEYIDQEVMNPKLDSMKSYLKLEFDDITKSVNKMFVDRKRQFQRFNIEHLELVRQFVAKIPTDEDLIIHCDAGLSRSAALGEALGILLHKEVTYERSRTYPNSFVLRVVKRYWDNAN